jgi:hypothetical protein
MSLRQATVARASFRVYSRGIWPQKGTALVLWGQILREYPALKGRGSPRESGSASSPGGAIDSSPWRQPWVRNALPVCSAPEGRKSRLVQERGPVQCFLRPSGADTAHRSFAPHGSRRGLLSYAPLGLGPATPGLPNGPRPRVGRKTNTFARHLYATMLSLRASVLHDRNMRAARLRCLPHSLRRCVATSLRRFGLRASPAPCLRGE